MNDLSKSIYLALLDGINNNGYASFIVSGGSSPIKIFNELSESNLNWSKVYISLVDDRSVSSKHIDSNEKLLKENLLINNASNANFISLKSNPEKVLEMSRPFDVMLLGMGEDGHFASLFPSLINTSNYFNLLADPGIIYTEPMGSPCHKRISMNLSMIIESKKVVLLISNEKKLSLLSEAYENNLLPLYYLLAQERVDVEIVKTF
ncbi:MAG: 6-phosphogluconolactonase [Gammaproteobacteria bacterium]|jgi:6-phosphogluconolactonase|tara:strand:+ start:2711 stop:3328 length:618 start_codon:yes stop_codon:yes gene_type:complete